MLGASVYIPVMVALFLKDYSPHCVRFYFLLSDF